MPTIGEHGDIVIGGKGYRVRLESYRERDIVDALPRAAMPTGQNVAFSELGLYQPYTIDSWHHGFGFVANDSTAGYMTAEGNIETGVTGLLLLGAKATSSDTNNNAKNGGVVFGSDFYAWGAGGVRRYASGAWADVYTAGAVNFAFTNGKYIFIFPDGAAGTKATGTITVASQPNNNDTTTVGKQKYTWKTTLTGAADEIVIGASANASADNLKRAVNKEGVEGTNYGAGTAANAHVTATVSTNVVTLTAKEAGVWGNSIIVVTDGTRLTDTNMGSGAQGKADKATGTITLSSQPNNNDTTVVGPTTYTWKTTLTGAAGEIFIGADSSASADNLKRALNDEGTEATNYGTGTAVNTKVEAMVAANVVTLLAKTYGANGNTITVTTDGTRLTDTNMSGGADGARALKSDTGNSGSWTLVGVDANPPLDMKGAAIQGGYHWAFEDGTAYVHYSNNEGLTTLEGNGASDAAVVTVGAGNVPVTWLEGYNNVLYAGREDGLYAINADGGFTARQVVNFSNERASDNLITHAVFNGALYFPVRNKVYRWNGANLYDVTPKPISATYPYTQYGRWRNFTVRGGFLYCTARTNETTYTESILKFDGSAWHKVADPITDGTGTISTLAVDTANNYLWYHLDLASDATYYIPLQALSDLPFADHPTTGTQRVTSSEIDLGFKRVKKSAPNVQAVSQNLTANRTVLVEYNADNGGWKTLGTLNASPYQELGFGDTIEFYKMLLRLTLATNSATQSPVLDSLTLRTILRPEVAYGYSFEIVASDYVEYGARLDERRANEIVEDIRTARDSKRPVTVTMLRGETFPAYLTAVQAIPVERRDSRQDDPGIEFRISVSLVELQ